MSNFAGWDEELELVFDEIEEEAVDTTLEALREQLSGGTLNVDSGRLLNSLQVERDGSGFTISTNVIYGIYWEQSGKKPWATNAQVESKLNGLGQ